MEVDTQSKLIVRDTMVKGVISVKPDTTMREVKEIMRLKSIAGMPVVDEQRKLVGVISIADVFQAMDDDCLDALVKDRMTRNVHTVKPDDLISVALALFRRFKFGRLPVVNDDYQVVGIITTNDIVKRLACFLKLDEITGETVKMPLEDSEREAMEFNIEGGDFDNAGYAASNLKRNLQGLGIAPQIIRKAAIAAYEAEMNIVIHANEGVLRASITPEKLRIHVKDTGPGINDVNQAMELGFSTAPDHVREMGFGAGMGLPNIRKSSDKFEIKSVPGQGTELNIEIDLKGRE